MAKDKSNGNSDTVTESEEGSEFDEIAFEQSLANSDPTLINSEEAPEDLSEETETEEEAEAEEEFDPEEIASQIAELRSELESMQFVSDTPDDESE